jgi:hypothetical protein
MPAGRAIAIGDMALRHVTIRVEVAGLVGVDGIAAIGSIPALPGNPVTAKLSHAPVD